MAYAEKRGKLWRGRYRRPDGSWGSTAGHSTKRRALDAAEDEESRVRHNTWIDPRVAERLFVDFAEDWFAAVRQRLSRSTTSKYRSYLDRQLLPQWGQWPMIGIFNSYLEIEKWVAELHDDYAESSVAAYFALFSTIMNAAVRARVIPASPCPGIQVTSGHQIEHLVAEPLQGIRASMRLYESGLGLSGLVLCLVNLYTGARWGELVGQERSDYDEINRAIGIREPLKEDGGRLFKGGQDVTQPRRVTQASSGRQRRVGRDARTKTPESTRWVTLPPGIADLYELLLEDRTSFVFVSPDGLPWYRSNFRIRFWRPAWDGVKADDPDAKGHVPPILPSFTFHEGRHTHSTWMVEDSIPEVARRARLGHRMPGIARVYEHVSTEMERQILDRLDARWTSSLMALTIAERDRLATWLPQLRPVLYKLREARNAQRRTDGQAVGSQLISQISPSEHGDSARLEGESGA